MNANIDYPCRLEDIKTHLAEQRSFMQQLLNEQLAAIQEQTQILRSISTRQAVQGRLRLSWYQSIYTHMLLVIRR